MNRPSFSMIESIFVIVIMGITLLSAPLLIRQSINSIEAVTIDSKALYHSLSQLLLINSHAWDKNNCKNQNCNIEGGQLSFFYDILDTDEDKTNTSKANLECNGTTHIRKGQYSSNDLGNVARRRCSKTGENAANITDPNTPPKDDSTITSLNDFNGFETQFVTGSENTIGGSSSNQFKIKTKVEYVGYVSNYENGSKTLSLKSSDNGKTDSTTNIKRIKLTTTVISGDKTITSYTYYAPNIGINDVYHIKKKKKQ